MLVVEGWWEGGSGIDSVLESGVCLGVVWYVVVGFCVCVRVLVWGFVMVGKDSGNLKMVRLWWDVVLCVRKLWSNLC